MDTDRAAAKLRAVEHDVIGDGARRAGVALNQIEVVGIGHGEGVMHRAVAVLLLGVLKQREVGDPQELVVVRVEQTELLRAVDAQRAQRVEDDAVFVGADQDEVAVLQLHARGYFGVLLGREEFGERGRDLAAVHLRPGEPLGTIGLGKLGKRVDLLAGECAAALHVDGADAAACGKRACEDLELGVLHNVGEILQLKAEAQVGLIRTEALHRLLPLHAEEGRLKIDAVELLPQTLEEAFGDGDDIILANKGHLNVDLRELGLAVGAQILVAEAAGDLEIAVKTRHHQQLLVQLGRLGQRIELAGMHAAGHEVVARALGRGLDEVGRLDVDKAVLGVVVARDLGDAGAREDILLNVGTAQVEIAVGEAKLGTDIAVLLNRKRRGLRGREDAQLMHGNFDFAGCHLRVDCSLAAGADRALGKQDVLTAHRKRAVEHFLVGLFVKCELQNAAAVAQIDENERAEVTLALCPAHHADRFADVLCGEFAAARGARVFFTQ